MRHGACVAQMMDRGGGPYAAERAHLRTAYERARHNAGPVFEEMSRHARAYTLHGVKHVDALWSQLDLVVGPVPINPLETFVLGCAFLFHDIAMGLIPSIEDVVQAYGEEEWRDLVAVAFYETRHRWPSDAELDNPPDDVYSACRSQAIGETHAARSAELVEEPFHLPSGGQVYLIEDAELRDAFGVPIAKLVASHWWSVEQLREHFSYPMRPPLGFPAAWEVDLLLLASMLRVADATHIGGSREPSSLVLLRSAQGQSWEHWRFQSYMCSPRLVGDRLRYQTVRPFERHEASAWWRTLSYLRYVDRELKRVDSLLVDAGRQRLAARGIADIDLPEHFADVVPVKGWRPVDVDIRVSDLRALISKLGGEQLYGAGKPEVALRELIQNGQDAVRARRVMEPAFEGRVMVTLEQRDGDWFLKVRDDGVGMDEDVMRHALLDFGRSGWRSGVVRRDLRGLLSLGFRPIGTFGLGFYSVLMVGDDVRVVSRRFDRGQHEALLLEFNNGLATRPMLSPLPDRPPIPVGTVVTVRLKSHPLAPGGLLAQTRRGGLADLVKPLVLSHDVPIVVEEGSLNPKARPRTILPQFDLATASPEEVFDRLYPVHSGLSKSEAQHAALRDEFCAQATGVTDDAGRRIGLAVLGRHMMLKHSEMYGVVVLGGFQADEHADFTGYFTGLATRASRDNIELACTPEQLARWVISQEQRLRERGLFTPSVQLELAEILHNAVGTLADDHHFGLTSDGLLTMGEIEAWARSRDHVCLSFGAPCEWETRPPSLWDRNTEQKVTPPDGWLILGPPSPFSFFHGKLPDRRDPPDAEPDRRTAAWQTHWWRDSAEITGMVIKRLCTVWACSRDELLAPVEDCWWTERADLDLGDGAEVSYLRLGRPR